MEDVPHVHDVDAAADADAATPAKAMPRVPGKARAKAVAKAMPRVPAEAYERYVNSIPYDQPMSREEVEAAMKPAVFDSNPAKTYHDYNNKCIPISLHGDGVPDAAADAYSKPVPWSLPTRHRALVGSFTPAEVYHKGKADLKQTPWQRDKACVVPVQVLVPVQVQEY